MIWYYYYQMEFGLKPTNWPIETNKDQIPYFNYIFLSNTSIHTRPFLIIHQTNPLLGPVIRTSFKSLILYIIYLRRTNHGISNNKIFFDNSYLSDRFNQMNINNLVPLSASSMNSIKTKFIKDISKPVSNISKKQVKDKYNKTSYETLSVILLNWPE